jgi:hypothetical protein
MAGIETYYVCEGWQLGLHTAVIHRGDCSQCNEGQGSGNEISAAGCRWYGPFSNANVAMDRSAALRDVAVLITCRCVEEVPALVSISAKMQLLGRCPAGA